MIAKATRMTPTAQPGGEVPLPGAVGRRRRLRHWLDPSGVIVGLAVDHRDAIRAAWERRGHGPPSIDVLRSVKRDLIADLGPLASVALVDEELGAAAIALDLPLTVGLVMPLEAQGYESIGDGRATRLLDGFSPHRASAYGADGCKLLLPYRPDHPASRVEQEAVLTVAARDCAAAGMPLLLEPIVYRLPDESDEAYLTAFPALVAETAGRLAQLGPDILKVQFPAGASDELAACQAIDDACASVPWVLLGGGEHADVFADRLAVAGRAGASGFIVGRTVWEPALESDVALRRMRIRTICRDRLERLRTVAVASCTSLLNRR